MTASIAMPWVLLGSELAPDLPGLAGSAGLLLLFAFALWRAAGTGERCCLAVGLAGGLALCLGTEGLWLLTGLTMASYGLLAALAAAPTRGPSGGLAAATGLVVLGDLALFELVLVAGDVAGGTALPLFPPGVDIAGKEGALLAFAGIGFASRGALLLPTRGHRGMLAPVAGLLLLALPLAAWRSAGAGAAVAVPALAAVGLGTGAVIAAALRRSAHWRPPGSPTLPGVAPQLPFEALEAALVRAEQGLRTWTVALVLVVVVLLALLLAATLPGGPG